MIKIYYIILYYNISYGDFWNINKNVTLKENFLILKKAVKFGIDRGGDS